MTDPAAQRSFVPVLLSVIYLAAIASLAFGLEREDFSRLAVWYFLAFGSYLFILGHKKKGDLKVYLGLAVLTRLTLWWSFPNLSDDIYRFIWDGLLWKNGIHPFFYLPAEIMALPERPEGITPELFALLNSPGYYTVYPPLAQLTFWAGALISPANYYGAGVVMKSFLLAAELGSMWYMLKLLRLLKLPERKVLIYALNPLVVVEVMGNLHFEGVMIFLLMAGIYALAKRKFPLSAVAVGLSISAKLLPLMFLPFWIKRLGRHRWMYFGLLAATLLLTFLPLLNREFLFGFGSSLDLYFRKFEFNAGIYYLLRWIGFQWRGYNLIHYLGPAMAVVVLSGILLAAWREQKPTLSSLFTRLLAAITLYLFLATTIHPWYLCLPLALCLFTSYRYPVLWSGLIFLTYFNYSQEPYREVTGIVILEYAAVWLLLLWEWFRGRMKSEL